MAVDAPISVAETPPEIACVAAEGCSYLRALSTIEHIAGFEHTARNYAASASRCRERGCWAAAKAGAAPPSAAAQPILLPVSRRASPRVTALGRDAEPVPFIRSNLIDVISDRDGNYVERRGLKLGTLPARGDSLGSLYQYWRDLRAAGASLFSNIDTVQLSRAGIIGKLHVVDVSSSDPEDFRFELFGYDVPIGRYESPRAYPIAILADSVMRDYNTVRLTAAPRLHRVRCQLDGVAYHYTRLILPFVNQRSRVTRLLVTIRQEAGDGVTVEPRD